MPDGVRDWSTGELGDELGIQAWRINRLFELGLLGEPPRVAGRRMIPSSMIPDIIKALDERGWMSIGRDLKTIAGGSCATEVAIPGRASNAS